MSDLDISRLQQQSYRRGQRDMLARCIAAVEAIGHYSECIPLHEDGYSCTHEEVIDVLRVLQEKP